MKRVRILLADDHTMISAGFQKLLEPHYEVVGSVEDGRALLKAAGELKPDVVLLDVGMPLLNGLDAARGPEKVHASREARFSDHESRLRHCRRSISSRGLGLFAEKLKAFRAVAGGS
jgi:DNA-binding NarL/FixJ family response regulator